MPPPFATVPEEHAEEKADEARAKRSHQEFTVQQKLALLDEWDKHDKAVTAAGGKSNRKAWCLERNIPPGTFAGWLPQRPKWTEQAKKMEAEAKENPKAKGKAKPQDVRRVRKDTDKRKPIDDATYK